MGRSFIVLLLVVCACGGPAWGEAYLKSFRAAQRAYHAGRYEEAAALYERAAGEATRVKDRDEAMFMRARMYERMRRFTEARVAYKKLIETSPKGPRTGRALYEYATIEIEQGNAEAGWRLLREAIERYPDHGSARRALGDWAQEVVRRDGEGGLRRELAILLERVRGHDVEQQAKYEHAMSLERSGELRGAHDAFVMLARDHPYPEGTLTDDAWLRAAKLAEDLGDHRQAIDDLHALLAVREVAQGGSYERPRYPEAQMRIAEIYRDGLRDRQAARREFRKTYRNHSTSILADDAMWQAALLSLELGDRGDACSVAKDLRKREPASRYRKCVHELCNDVESVKGERPCPPYLKRQLNGKSQDE
ncbi:MAG TPA: tetratricopeptide repeat protein [Polyangiaceae bacterium]|nr:tetratricopeptide repeat protein [Polyangiaceae bacterium]